jgi:hypothetical protein
MGIAGRSSGDRVERAVLALLLSIDGANGQPVTALVEEIGDPAATMYALERLQLVGLVEVSGDRARSSPAARRFDELNL